QNVRRLEVAMHDAALVRVLNRLAHLHISCQQLAKRHERRTDQPRVLERAMELIRRSFECLTVHESHRVEQPVRAVESESVNRHDERMIQSTCDFSLN